MVRIYNLALIARRFLTRSRGIPHTPNSLLTLSLISERVCPGGNYS